MTTTSIEWTDRVWNPVTGCTKVSPGCKHCYAEGVADRFWAKQYPEVLSEGCAIKTRPRKFTDVLTHADRLDQPLRWKKPARIFVNSMSDLFHEDVPLLFIDDVFATMAMAPQHTFQILTKRPTAMHEYLSRPGKAADIAVEVFKRFTTLRESGRESLKAVKVWPLPNVWLGVSAENQQYADERIPLLLQTPAAVRFISAEPLLGPVEFSDVTRRSDAVAQLGKRALCGIDWVIVGGESGTHARDCAVEWVRSIREQCRSVGVPCFVKQLGRQPQIHAPGLDDAGQPHSGVYLNLRNKKGGDMAEWPTDLRVREFPA